MQLSVMFVFTVNTAQFHVGMPFFQFREYTPAPLGTGSWLITAAIHSRFLVS